MIRVSAPGKVHLIGEHAVVYGQPAILAAVGLRTTVDAEKSDRVELDIHGKYRFDFSADEVMAFTSELKKMWDAGNRQKDFSPVFGLLNSDWVNYYKMMAGISFGMLGIPEGGIRLVVKTGLPIGSGLGSSASFAVAIAKAISEVYRVPAPEETINEIAFRMEQFVHGMPSGGDNSACCYGGLIWFRKAQTQNEIVPLRDEIPYSLDNFVLVYTKKPEKSTGELVQMVKNMDPAARDPHVTMIGRLADEMRAVLKQKKFPRMKEIINETNDHLAALGLSIPETEQVAQAVKAIGGAAKMCGACYGGVMLCYHEDQDLLAEAIRSAGFEPWKTALAVEGVRMDRSI